MLSESLAERYAQAIFDIAQEKKLTLKFSRQLNDLVRLFKTQTNLENLLLAPHISKVIKKDIFKKALQAKIDVFILNFLYLLIDKKREKFFYLIVEKFNQILERKEKSLSVIITTAIEIPDKLRDKITKRFSEYFQKKVKLKIQVNPQIIGGLITKTEDELIDGSLRKYLSDMVGQN